MFSSGLAWFSHVADGRRVMVNNHLKTFTKDFTDESSPTMDPATYDNQALQSPDQIVLGLFTLQELTIPIKVKFKTDQSNSTKRSSFHDAKVYNRDHN